MERPRPSQLASSSSGSCTNVSSGPGRKKRSRSSANAITGGSGSNQTGTGYICKVDGGGTEGVHSTSSKSFKTKDTDYNDRLEVLILKVLFYSRKPQDQEEETISSKFAKYLNELRTHCCQLSSGGGTASSESGLSGSSSSWLVEDAVEIKLRKKGALQAISEVIKNVIQSFDGEVGATHITECTSTVTGTSTGEVSQKHKAPIRETILSNGLSILSNAFAVDYVSREEAFKDSTVLTFNKILQNASVPLEIHAKALKCLGNLAADKQCRSQIFNVGVASNILNEITRLAPKSKLATGPGSCFGSQSVEKVLCNAVRTIRILCNDAETRALLLRNNALIIVGEILMWFEQSESGSPKRLQSTITLEIVKALNCLTRKFRLAPPENIYELIENKPILDKLVFLFKTSDRKVLLQLTQCLANLAEQKEVVSSLTDRKIYDILFSRMERESEINVLDHLSRFFKSLVCDESVICKYLLPYSNKIFVTLKLLKLSELENYHQFILSVYQSLIGGPLDILIDHGLVDLLEELLNNIYVNCTFDKLSKRISALDEIECPIHASSCHYTPTYRCMSPTFAQVRDEVNEYLIVRSYVENDEKDHRRKMQASPAHSWGSSGFVSDNSVDMLSPSSSGRASPINISRAVSDDEGFDVSETSPLFSQHRTEFSGTEGEQLVEEGELPNYKSCEDETPLKKRKIDETDILEHKSNTEKMVVIIDILKNITFMKPFRTCLLKFVPALLSILCDGKLNCKNYMPEMESMVKLTCSAALNKHLFYGSHRMLQEFFQDFNNFSYVLEANIIPLLHRLIVFGNQGEAWNSELQKCNQVLRSLMSVLTGEGNNTVGYRQGFLTQNLRSCELKEKVAIAIPLLYHVDCYDFRHYQLKHGAWTTLFSILENLDDNSSLFEDCIVSISALCRTMGLKWTERACFAGRSQLSNARPTEPLIRHEAASENNESIIIELDDGSDVQTSKQLLTNKSPVFSAMFDGNFIEANQLKVKLPSTSKKALHLLLEELQIDSGRENSANSSSTQPNETSTSAFDIRTLFELLNISNQYMLEEIQTKVFNTLVSNCLCPYAAPEIYGNIVKKLYETLGSSIIDSTDLTRLVLKYLLVDERIGPNLQCTTFKKIFDTIEPSIVLSDLKSFLQSFINNVLCTPPPSRNRNSLGNFELAHRN